MRHIVALVIVVGAVAVGVVAGLAGDLTVAPLSGSAGAAPPPPQQREDQITIFSEAGSSGFASIVPSPFGYGPLSGACCILLGFDAADYSPSSFRFEGVWGASSGSTTCLRLFDRTANSAVPGAEVCHTIPQNTGTEYVRVRSAAFSLPTTEHEYTVQGRCEVVSVTSCSGAGVASTRVIAEWTERTR